jgi:SAM-dependent methyltransferase
VDLEKNSNLGLTERRLCASCISDSLSEVYDFGQVPLAGYFPHKGETFLPLLPMKLLFCEECSLYQISPDISDDYLFRDYRYISSVGMQSHFDRLSEWFVATEKPALDSRILEFGCNDGPLLDALVRLGFSPIGIDPAVNIVELAHAKGLTVIADFFNLEAVRKYDQLRNLDYIFSSNSFAHISKIRDVAAAVSAALAPGGKFIVEVQSVDLMYQKKAFDFIYHEHKYYYSVESMCSLLGQFEMSLVSFMKIDTHGGSLRLMFEKNSQPPQEKKNEKEKRNYLSVGPRELGLAISDYAEELKKLDLKIQLMVSQGKRIAAFGASGRANMLLGNLPILRTALRYVIDESPERIGRLMAQNEVEIVSLDDFVNQEVEVMVILAWNFAESIISKLNPRNIEVVIPLPTLDVLTF